MRKHKKTAPIVGDAIVNDIEKVGYWKHHIRVQPIPGTKMQDIQLNLGDLLHENSETEIIHGVTGGGGVGRAIIAPNF